MKNIYDFTLEELEDYFVKVGDKKYRATQIYEFLYNVFVILHKFARIVMVMRIESYQILQNCM